MDGRREAAFFTRMIAAMLTQLKRIAGSTQGEHSVDDLKNEAYLVAADVRADLDYDVEPEDERLQATVIEKIQKLFGRFVNRPMRYAARLDRDEVDDDGELVGSSLAARLAAPAAYEPHVALEQREEANEAKRRIDERFSEAVAYLRVLEHFDGNKRVIANYLAIHARTLDARLSRAGLFAERQPSMFDGIDAVPENFAVRRGIRRFGRPQHRFGRLCVLMRPWQPQLFRNPAQR